MKNSDIAQQRLRNQHLSSPAFIKPAALVQWLGAVQAQDYYDAKWALGQRLQDATDEGIEKAFTEGKILRTHVMRPTWHFIAPADIRWMLKLTAPRVNALNAYYYRKLELDIAVFKRTNKALASELQGGEQLTRAELRRAVQQAGIATDDPLRFNYILIRAELDGVICSGARKGRRFTYALLDERAPHAKRLERDEALAELTRRYFTSHGPATEQDFAWWSGLTTADARLGLDMVRRQMVKEAIKGKAYWFPVSTPSTRRGPRSAYLLPAFDEYLVAYKDRSAALGPAFSKQSIAGNPLFDSSIVINGRVVGGWQRVFKKSSVIITLRPFAPLNGAERKAVARAAGRYGAFLGMPVEVKLASSVDRASAF